MNNFKSHFKFNKQERSGIFFLALIIVLLQVVYVFFASLLFSTKPSEDSFSLNQSQQEQVVILKQKSLEKETYELYPFNPNFITDYKGYKLGMSLEEINRLHVFRTTNKFVNSDKEFQEVTRISDSLLHIISPYFKFPDWVKAAPKVKAKPNYIIKNSEMDLATVVYKDINTATAEDLRKIYGIGDKLSARIIKFRDRLGGFIEEDQLKDVYGLEPEVVKRVYEKYKLLSKPTIDRINVNTASASEISKLVYLSYQVSKNIVIYREANGKINSIDELKKIEGFPSEKINRISLYLAL